MLNWQKLVLFAAAAIVTTATAGRADSIKIGATVSATGSAAALGAPQKESFEVLPAELAGQKVEWIVLDDASDGTKSAANARKLITEQNVDVLIGSTIAPTSMPLVDIAAEAKVPLLSPTATAAVIEPMDDKRRWVFKIVPNDRIMVNATTDYMAKQGVKTVGFIGFNDAYGDGWYRELEKIAPSKGIKIIAREAFARTDTSVTGQVLKLLAANPDAILIAASGTPAVLPQKSLRERGFNKPIYQTQGVVTPAFIQLGGKSVEGTVLAAGPFAVVDQLPENDPIRKTAEALIAEYKKKFNKPALIFAAHQWDIATVLQRAIPIALKSGKPGTPEFRSALRDAIENLKEVPLINGFATYSPTDHNGYDQRAASMMKVQNGKFELIR
jgi:branched-chain amino acid transport system substrate-binding protein